MSNEEKNSIETLITREILGEATAEESRKLTSWRDENPQNEKIYQEFKRVLQLTSGHIGSTQSFPEKINVEEEWLKLKDNLTSSVQVKSLSPARTMLFQQTWIRVAAAVVIIFLSALAINYFISNSYDTKILSRAEQVEQVLSDNSIVTLNSNSKLSYSKNFNVEKREIFLEGEAFFEVESNPEKPFLIHANNTLIEVVGTSFNVMAYKKEKQVEVVVASGVVRFSVQKGNDSVTLNAGDKGIYFGESNQLQHTTNQDINYQSWKTHQIIFAETSLNAVLQTLSKVYHVDFIVAEDLSPGCEVTVTFDEQTIDAVMKVLEATLNLTYTIKGNQIEITSIGC